MEAGLCTEVSPFAGPVIAQAYAANPSTLRAASTMQPSPPRSILKLIAAMLPFPVAVLWGHATLTQACKTPPPDIQNIWEESGPDAQRRSATAPAQGPRLPRPASDLNIHEPAFEPQSRPPSKSLSADALPFLPRALRHA